MTVKYRKLGRTGLTVSGLSFGCINFGNSTNEKDAIELVRKAYALGINHFDTADAYPLGGMAGLSEEILGKAVKPFRNEILLGTKVQSRTGEGPNDEGLSRHHILSAVETSLRRLQTDYLDLYMTHGVDPWTPFDETLRAFDDLVHSGKVRYIGCSNFDAWQICKALWVSDKHGLARFDFIQSRYNLITRAIEAELVPFCASEHVGLFVYNPLAGGLLTGGLYQQGGTLASVYKKDAAPPKGGRLAFALYQARYWHERNLEAVAKLQGIAKRYGHTPPQMALAWLLSNRHVTSVLTCADFVDQLAQNVSAVDISLSDSAIAECNEVYEDMLPPGWSTQEGADFRRQWAV